jgi:SAM-dependent methyltransferase
MRRHYETLPYPARDPKDEAKRLIAGSPSHILEVDHYLFAGRRDWSRPFRVLVAGGGTGDAAIMLAQHLADRRTPAEIHYLDMSAAARQVAEARAQARGLTSLQFHTGSLLDLPGMGLVLGQGKFDYIDCTGVLHHLDDPAAGLAALAAVLAPDGGMGLMVYGALGRTGVYPIQEMLRVLAPDDQVPEQRIKTARRLLAALPKTNWFARNPFVGDHIQGGDAGLYDLLLHSRDRAYRVAEFDALVRGAGLGIVRFIEPARYDPATYLNDPALLRSLAGLTPIESAVFAEALVGNITKHVAYVTWPQRASQCVARIEGPRTVPVLRQNDGAKLAAGLQSGGMLKADLDGFEWRCALPRLAGPIVSRVDGNASLGDIYAALRALDRSLEWEQFARQFDSLFGALNAANVMLLRNA